MRSSPVGRCSAPLSPLILILEPSEETCALMSAGETFNHDTLVWSFHACVIALSRSTNVRTYPRVHVFLFCFFVHNRSHPSFGSNICHGSDAVQSAKDEIALWFPGEYFAVLQVLNKDVTDFASHLTFVFCRWPLQLHFMLSCLGLRVSVGSVLRPLGSLKNPSST